MVSPEIMTHGWCMDPYGPVDVERYCWLVLLMTINKVYNCTQQWPSWIGVSEIVYTTSNDIVYYDPFLLVAEMFFGIGFITLRTIYKYIFIENNARNLIDVPIIYDISLLIEFLSCDFSNPI